MSIRSAAPIFLALLVSVLVLAPAASMAQSASPGATAASRHPALTETDATSCRECHDDLLAGPFVHGSVEGPTCGGCHVFEGAGEATRVRLLREATRDRALPLCGECHAAIASAAGAPGAHAPVKAGDCLRCHAMHRGRRARLLSATTREVCTSCHPDTRADLALAVVHAPAAADCAICHEPHARGHGKTRLRARADDLCLGCHLAPDEPTARTEPAEIPGYTPHRESRPLLSPARRVRLGHGRAEGQDPGCMHCHAPHGSTHKALTRTLEP